MSAVLVIATDNVQSEVNGTSTKKLVIDTLCTTASTVTFDTEEHDKYVAENTIEQYFDFNDFSSTTSFASFLKTCIEVELILFIRGENKEQTVTSIHNINLNDTYLQEQLDIVLIKTLDNHKSSLNTDLNYVPIFFHSDSLLTSSSKLAITTTNIVDESNKLKVSYCYPTREWRCLYRCEIDSIVDLTLFGSVNNPTDED
ncbi:unnamed protein product [Rotaria sp. Silwood1]|nr:unnamed protein product [Rotaria sp. Silwood1]